MLLEAKTFETKPSADSKTYSVPCAFRFAGVSIVHAVMHAISSESATPNCRRTLSSFFALSVDDALGLREAGGASRMSAVVFDTFCSRCVTLIAICL